MTKSLQKSPKLTSEFFPVFEKNKYIVFEPSSNPVILNNSTIKHVHTCYKIPLKKGLLAFTFKPLHIGYRNIFVIPLIFPILKQRILQQYATSVLCRHIKSARSSIILILTDICAENAAKSQLFQHQANQTSLSNN